MSYWKPGGAKGGDSNSTTPRGGAKSVPGSVEREKNKKTLITPISKPMGIDESSPVLSKSVMSMKVCAFSLPILSTNTVCFVLVFDSSYCYFLFSSGLRVVYEAQS